MSQPDGLSALQGRREAAAARRRQPMPPPKHPRRDPPDRAPAAPASEETRAEPTDLVAEPAPAPTRPAAGRGRGGSGLRLGQFYLDESADDWLREIRLTAMHQRQDITASAVVRWALARAAAQMTVQQVVDELLAAQPRNTGRGRPRR